ncbi:MAG: HD domain-containing protein [Proteobacteria bacterium]|nr:HD domain-containing protein [Pseudomonadota bacterium]MBU1057321.1 HD domain-containing protein [Pseudomonadota bacterium]
MRKEFAVRISTHYFAAALILTLYGSQVCPFLESLSFFRLLTAVCGPLFLVFLFRLVIGRKILKQTSPPEQPKCQFFIESGALLLAGLGTTLFNVVFYQFPLVSGLKLVIGGITLAFFVGIDMALARERWVAEEFATQLRDPEELEEIFPLTRKMALVGVPVAFLAGAILSLVILQDLEWIRDLSSDASLVLPTQAVIAEIFFVVAVLLLYVINLIISYAGNLKIFFDRQSTILIAASQGKLDGFVPITTNDEFALIGHYTNTMIKGLRERTEALASTRDVTIRVLASLAETRDNETGQHIIRTQHYVRILAEKVRHYPPFRDELDEATIELLFKSAPLHDVGKVGIPDRILLKPGRLTAEEFEVMKRHTLYGRNTLRVAEAELGEDSFLHLATEIAYTHHEKWDGSGYPQGLKGSDIPLSGRLMAVADVYDALISRRIYKPPFSHPKAYNIILAGKGSHFDPAMVDAFVECEESFKRVAAEHADRE